MRRPGFPFLFSIALFLLPEFLNGQVLGSEVGAIPVGPAFPIVALSQADIGGRPAIATDGANFIVTSEDATHIYATRVTTSGSLLDPTPILVTTNSNGVDYPSVAFDGTNYLLVWVGYAETGYEVFGSRVTPGGVVLDAPAVQLTNGANADLRPIALAFDGTNYLTAWRTEGSNIMAARVSKAVANLDASTGFSVTTSGESYYPWATFGAGEYLIVWHYGYGGSGGGGCTAAQGCLGSLAIAGARVTPAGHVLDPNGFTISSDPTNLQDHASVAFDGTNFMAVWHNWANSDVYNNGSVSGARIAPAGVVLDQPAIAVASRAEWEAPPAVVFDGTNYFVVWHVNDSPEKFRLTDVYGTRVSPAGYVLDERPSPIATKDGHQWGPTVGCVNSTFLAAWHEDASTSSSSCPGCVYGQILQEASNSGTPRASATPTATASAWSSIGGPSTTALQTVFGLDESNVYAAGELSPGGILQYDGFSWSAIIDTNANTLFGAWGASPAGVWFTGWCWDIVEFNGTSFNDLYCTDMGAGHSFSVWGSNPDNIFAVGMDGIVSHFDGQKWDPTGNIGVTTNVAGIWGTGADNIYAVGEYGTILRYDGSLWNSIPDPATVERLNGIWGASRSDIFAVGDFGTVLHFDGTSWTAQASGVLEHLTGVWGFNGSDVHAVGFNGRILHYDGSSWTAQASPTTENLMDVGGAGNSVWAVGDAGAIVQLITTGNPTPEIVSISPGSVPPTQNATIQVNGKNFVSGSTVRWNESDVPTVFVSSTQLTATIPEGNFASAFHGNALFPAGWGEITVSNPAPQGGISPGQVLVMAPTVIATLSSPSITTTQPLQVTVTVSGGSGAPVPTGTVALTSGSYTSPATPLNDGSSTISVPGGTLIVGTDTYSIGYSGDSNYTGSTVSGSVIVTLSTAAVTVTPGASSIATTQPLSVAVAVSGGTGNPTPTGSVTLTGGSYTSAATALNNGSATISIPGGTLAVGTDAYSISYSGDWIYTGSTSGGSVIVTLSTAAVTVTPGTSSIATTQPLSVTVAVSGGSGNPTPTGSVTLTGGSYTSAPTALSGGIAAIDIAANVLRPSNYSFTASYTPDSSSFGEYGSATGTASSSITVMAATPTVAVTPGASSIATTQPLSVTVAVSGGTGNPTPTGSVTLTGGSYTSAATALNGGSATINLAANALRASSYTFTASYTPDSSSFWEYGSATGTASSSVTVMAATPTVAVTPGASSIATTQPLSVTVAVSGGTGDPTPTGSVTLTGGGYASAPTALSGGIATIDIAANALRASSYTLTASYTPDSSSSSEYGSATGTASSSITVTAATPTVTVTPGASSIATTQPLSVTVAVSGGTGNPTPTGSVTLTGGSYTSAATALNGGSATINLAANALRASSYTFTASYTPDASSSSEYGSATGTASSSVTVTNAAFTLSATALTLSPGGSGTSTVTVNSTNAYAGTIALSCKVTASPAGAVDPPACSGSQTVTLSAGTTSGTATLTVSTTAVSSGALQLPRQEEGGGWRHAAGGVFLALLAFCVVPAKCRRAASGFCILGLMAVLAVLTACGGGGGGGEGGFQSNSGTTPGTYTITVTASGNDSASTTASTTFTLTVN
jgi:hypothetical protein